MRRWGRTAKSGSSSKRAASTRSPRSTPWATCTDGSLYFTLGNQIGKLTTSGTFTAYTIGMMAAANDICLGSDGNLWFCDNTNKIGRMTPSGTFTEWNIPTTGTAPLRIVSGPDGNLYFTESTASKIGRITSDGTGTFTEWNIPTLGSSPVGITSGPDGCLWFVESSANNVARMTTSGTFTEWAIPTSNAGASDIVVGSDNNLWFTESTANKVGTFKLTGPDYVLTPNCDMPDT
jgi:virginiamycin B lyase